MLNRKLLEILARLTEAEHKRLRLFLQSPFFHAGYHAAEILRLYDYIAARGAGENHPELDKARVSGVFFPDKPFREKEKGPIDSLASELLRLVRQFLHQLEVESARTEARELLSLARFYRHHSLEERFEQTIQAARKAQAAYPVRDLGYFLTQFRIEEEISNFKSIFNSNEDDINLRTVHQYLDTFYTICKLEYLCLLRYQTTMTQVEQLPRVPFTQAVLTLAADDPIVQIPITRAFQLVYTLIDNPENETALQEMETILAEKESSFPADKYRDLQAYYRFFWRRRYLRQGDPAMVRRLFDLFADHLRRGFFYVDGRMPINSLRVITIFALRLKEYDWVRQFLDNHPPERLGGTRYPQEAYNLNRAEYLFACRTFDEAAETLTYRAFENVLYSIQADLLLIKIYFETQNELLDARVKALDQKVRRSRIAPGIKERYYNFLKKLDKVIKYTWLKDKAKMAKIADEIRASTDIVEREWLLEKVK